MRKIQWTGCRGAFFNVLKITEQEGPEPDSVSLRLDGRLAGPWVDELRASCHRASTRRQRCAAIDLTGVTYIDGDGKALLAFLWRQGAELRASGCLTRCIVEEITGCGKFTPWGEKSDTV